MLGASFAVTTASRSTSHISAILRFRLSGTSRSARHTIASGWIPMLRRAATECCVGFVLSSPLGPMYGSNETCRKNTLSRPTSVSYTHLRAHETKANLVCRLLLEKKKKTNTNTIHPLTQQPPQHQQPPKTQTHNPKT